MGIGIQCYADVCMAHDVLIILLDYLLQVLLPMNASNGMNQAILSAVYLLKLDAPCFGILVEIAEPIPPILALILVFSQNPAAIVSSFSLIEISPLRKENQTCTLIIAQVWLSA